MMLDSVTGKNNTIETQPCSFSILSDEVRDHFFMRLEKILAFPENYPDFPLLDNSILSTYYTGELRKHSIIKKGAGYFVLRDMFSNSVDSMESFAQAYLFFCSEFELNSEHIALKKSRNIDELDSGEETEQEKIYSKILIYCMFLLNHNQSEVLGELKSRIMEMMDILDIYMYANAGFENSFLDVFKFLSVIQIGESFIVPGTDIIFEYSELEELKKRII